LLYESLYELLLEHIALVSGELGVTGTLGTLGTMSVLGALGTLSVLGALDALGVLGAFVDVSGVLSGASSGKTFSLHTISGLFARVRLFGLKT
jgi:hypothetical protein